MTLTSRGQTTRAMIAVVTTLALLAGLAMVSRPASAAGTFTDDDSSVHETAIERIAAAGLAYGCNPPQDDRFCPDQNVTRGQMAAFLQRLLQLPPGEESHFVDDSGSTFEDDIDAVAAAGITRGCNPPANDRYCPGRSVTRGEMAAFLTRALDLGATSDDFFGDDDSSVFEADINALARVGITRGCNPPANDRYCPDMPISRAEMASFLARALDIVTTGTTTTTKAKPTTTTEPTSTPTTTPTTTPPSGAFIEEGGIVVMEVESVPVADGWKKETSTSGYTGSAYFIRTGSHTTKTDQGTLTYRMHISQAGEYVVSIRSRRDKAPGENVENGQRNDVFVKMNSDQWWKATTHNDFGEWGWIDKKTIAHATFEPLVWKLGEGTHTFKISGRSQYVKIDRIHVYQVPGASDMSIWQLRNLNPGVNTPESERLP